MRLSSTFGLLVATASLQITSVSAGQISVVTPPNIVIVVPTTPTVTAPTVTAPAVTSAPAAPVVIAAPAASAPVVTPTVPQISVTGPAATTGALAARSNVALGAPPVAVQSFNVGALSAGQSAQAVATIESILATPGGISAETRALLQSQLNQLRGGQ
jgi:fused signal recognition particle receptor